MCVVERFLFAPCANLKKLMCSGEFVLRTHTSKQQTRSPWLTCFILEAKIKGTPRPAPRPPMRGGGDSRQASSRPLTLTLTLTITFTLTVALTLTFTPSLTLTLTIIAHFDNERVSYGHTRIRSRSLLTVALGSLHSLSASALLFIYERDPAGRAQRNHLII